MESRVPASGEFVLDVNRDGRGGGDLSRVGTDLRSEDVLLHAEGTVAGLHLNGVGDRVAVADRRGDRAFLVTHQRRAVRVLLLRDDVTVDLRGVDDLVVDRRVKVAVGTSKRHRRRLTVCGDRALERVVAVGRVDAGLPDSRDRGVLVRRTLRIDSNVPGGIGGQQRLTVSAEDIVEDDLVRVGACGHSSTLREAAAGTSNVPVDLGRVTLQGVRVLADVLLGPQALGDGLIVRVRNLSLDAVGTEGKLGQRSFLLSHEHLAHRALDVSLGCDSVIKGTGHDIGSGHTLACLHAVDHQRIAAPNLAETVVVRNVRQCGPSGRQPDREGIARLRIGIAGIPLNVHPHRILNLGTRPGDLHSVLVSQNEGLDRNLNVGVDGSLGGRGREDAKDAYPGCGESKRRSANCRPRPLSAEHRHQFILRRVQFESARPGHSCDHDGYLTCYVRSKPPISPKAQRTLTTPWEFT